MSEYRITDVFNDSALSILAVESLRILPTSGSLGYQILGQIETVAVIVCRPDRVDAVDTQAKVLDIVQLRRDVPGLDAALSAQADVLSSSNVVAP